VAMGGPYRFRFGEPTFHRRIPGPLRAASAAVVVSDRGRAVVGRLRLGPDVRV
jgi:hypothetical protein